VSTRKACGFLLSFVALFLLLVVALVAPALAIGLGVSPEKLNIEVSRGGSTTATLGVTNTGNDESNYKVYVEEDEYKDWFSIEPEEFVLSPQGNKGVEITISPPLEASGQYQAHICVVSMLPGEGLKIGTGIKVPTHIHVSAMPSLILLGAIGIAVLLIIVLVYVLWRKRRAGVV